MKKLNLALVYGGFSDEKEVSKLSALTVKNNLRKDKYKIYFLDLKKDFYQFLDLIRKKKVDLVVPVIHGWGGEDGRLQGLLDILNIPYIFSGYFAHAVAMNKKATKQLLLGVKVNFAKDIVIRKGEKSNPSLGKLKYPIIVKPNNSGSSIGVILVNNKNELARAISWAFEYDKELILEEFIRGREFSLPIYGNKNIKALSVIEIVPKISKWFDYKAKYTPGGSEEICPAKISKKLENKIKSIGVEIFKRLNCKDLSRIDFMVDKNEKIYFLEINTIPGFTPESLVPKALTTAKIKISDFLDKLIEERLR